VIAWSKAYPEISQARVRPEAPCPLPDASKRADLRSRFGHVIEDGLASLQKVLELDPGHDDAMAYLNLLHRLRADLSDSVEECRSETAIADEWVRRAIETKRSRAAAIPRPTNTPPVPNRSPGAPQRIRVGATVLGSRLVKKIDPAYPPSALQARIQGTVRFTVSIDKDGRVRNMTVISGHPLLVQAAVDAVKEWIYQPTLLNGEPVEVVSEAAVDFRLN
jgi:TonB family protein